jgi:hypothetical protein
MKRALEVLLYVAIAAFSAWLGWLVLAPALGGGAAAAAGGAIGGLTLALWARQGRDHPTETS